MKVLFLENDDSYSWNVVDCLRAAGAEVALRPGRAVLSREAMKGFDAAVIGPGPLDPVRAGLMGAVAELVSARLPLLGICLGHQALGLAFGARLVHASPAHGLRATICFRGSRFFSSIDGETEVMRYHSLALADVTSPLRATASTADGVVMAVEHESLPIAGLQFHPDSFGTPRGPEMVAAFLRSAR